MCIRDRSWTWCECQASHSLHTGSGKTPPCEHRKTILYKRASKPFTLNTANTSVWQPFCFLPTQLKRMRIVCLKTFLAFCTSHLHLRTATCIQEQPSAVVTCIQEQLPAFKNSHLHSRTATCIQEQSPAFKNSHLHSRTVTCIQEQPAAF